MNPQPGDIGFARNTGVMAKLIRLGEWLKFRKCEYNHMFVVSDEVDTDGHPLIIQAVIRGVTGTARLDSVAPGGKYITMRPPASRVMVLGFAKEQVGTKYSVLTILAIVIDIVTWNWFPAFANARRPSWICSGLTCEALRFGGWFHQWTNIYDVTPQQAFDVLTFN